MIVIRQLYELNLWNSLPKNSDWLLEVWLHRFLITNGLEDYLPFTTFSVHLRARRVIRGRLRGRMWLIGCCAYEIYFFLGKSFDLLFPILYSLCVMWLIRSYGSEVQKLVLYVKIILSVTWWLFSDPNHSFPRPVFSFVLCCCFVWEAILNHQTFWWENDGHNIILSMSNFLGNPQEKNY